MAFLDYFVGVTQSRYAAIAIFSAIFIICIGILFTNTEISLGSRLLVVFFVMLFSIFPVGLSLFELTCMVTGSKGNKYNACNVFAWFVAIMVVVYCFILIILSLISTFTYKKALNKIETTEMYNNISKEDADTIAKNMMEQNKAPSSLPMQQSAASPLMMPQPQPKPQPLPEPVVKMQQSSDDIPGFPESAGMFDEGANLMELDSQSQSQAMNLEKFTNLQKNKETASGPEPEPFSDDSNFSPLLA